MLWACSGEMPSITVTQVSNNKPAKGHAASDRIPSFVYKRQGVCENRNAKPRSRRHHHLPVARPTRLPVLKLQSPSMSSGTRPEAARLQASART